MCTVAEELVFYKQLVEQIFLAWVRLNHLLLAIIFTMLVDLPL